MSTIHAAAKTRNLFHEPVAAPDPADSLTIARGAGVTDAVSLLANCERVRLHHLVVTGEELSWPLTVHVCDQILSERKAAQRRATPSTPRLAVPDRLFPVASWLHRFGYAPEMIHLAVAEISLTGGAMGSCIIDGEDQSEVQAILDMINGIDVAV